MNNREVNVKKFLVFSVYIRMKDYELKLMKTNPNTNKKNDKYKNDFT